MVVLIGVLDEIRAKATELRDDFGDEARARALEWAADLVAATVAVLADEALTLTEAARECGYSPDHLGREVRAGRLPNAGRHNAPRIRRADLPCRKTPLRPMYHPPIVRRTEVARSVVHSRKERNDG